jgi:hypothetical protein
VPAKLRALGTIALVAILGCDNYDCDKKYQSTGAVECTEKALFRAMACDGELMDEDCYRECLEGARPGKYLCYDHDQCYSKCTEDDGSGCGNAYIGNDCFTYEEFYLAACDPRRAPEMQQCTRACNPSGGPTPTCATLRQCYQNCGAELP